MRQRPVIRRKASTPTGVLHNASADAARSRHDRYHPSPDLERHVEHYWAVSWDFRDAVPERVEILQHPSVHMTFESDSPARILGVTRGKFSRQLCEKGRIFGVKFTPGGFFPFFRAPVSQLTDRSVTLADVFGEDGEALARAMQTRRTDASRIATVEKFLTRRMPEPDANVVRVSAMVYAVAKDRTILKVDDLAARSEVNTRALQRLFAKYVGVSPKWVIQRYRLHEAAGQLASGAMKQTELALSLGYADQAHFVRDFKAVVGRSPAAYSASASGSRVRQQP